MELYSSWECAVPFVVRDGGKAAPSESQVIKIWQRQMFDNDSMFTEDGRRIKVVFPGRLNDDRGADFRDAVLATDEGMLKGDIEVHIKSSGWHEHGHDCDTNYNRVILHVVFRQDVERPVCLQNGNIIPTLELKKYTTLGRLADLVYPAAMPCGMANRYPERVAAFLDRSGEARFFAKAAGFQKEMSQNSPEQTLYCGIMGALGYSKNKIQFIKLAQSLPVGELEPLARGKISGEECLIMLQSLLLGTAGLLPSQRQNIHDEFNDGFIDALEQKWESFRRKQEMSRGEWHFFKVRPVNSPVRRLVAMSHLISRFRQKGLLETLTESIKEEQTPRKLVERLLVNAESYWVNHYDFGPKGRLVSPVLLGGGRASDIVINVLLPFSFALGQNNFKTELAEKAFRLYQSCSKAAVNSVEKHMIMQLGIKPRLIGSAQQQQGLIHIYNTLCTQGMCQDCELNQLETGDDVHV